MTCSPIPNVSIAVPTKNMSGKKGVQYRFTSLGLNNVFRIQLNAYNAQHRECKRVLYQWLRLIAAQDGLALNVVRVHENTGNMIPLLYNNPAIIISCVSLQMLQSLNLYKLRKN